jgi:hypothetical protein
MYWRRGRCSTGDIMERMIPRRSVFAVAGAWFAVRAQTPQSAETDERKGPTGVHLPSGQLQSDAIAKADYEATLQDARHLAQTSADLSAEIEKNDRFVISVSVIKKTEEIEKLAKRIRTRMKRY